MRTTHAGTHAVDLSAETLDGLIYDFTVSIARVLKLTKPNGATVYLLRSQVTAVELEPEEAADG